MEPKLLRQYHVEYIEAPYLGSNRSGWSPIGDYVLVQPDAIAKESSGGITLPDDIAERMQLAAITGVIVECGEEAFKWNADRSRLFEGSKPQAGDRVIFEKYAGKLILGEDGITYRILEDKSIGGIKRRQNIAPLKSEGRTNFCACCYLPVAEGHAPWCAYAERKS